ncbi:MAG: squalene--hopene cyclase [Chthoniobacteraceae bacterium]
MASRSISGWWGASLMSLLATASAQDPSLRFGGEIPTEVDAIYERGLTWLAANQSEDGSWTGGQTGPGVDGICLMAFLASGEDPNFGRYASSIRRAIRAIMQKQEAETGYLPNSMYHHGFAMLALSEAYGAVDETTLWEGGKAPRSIAEALQLAIRCAATAQKKNRWSGWRYSPDASDADTSVTGAVLMGLMAARNAGMDVPDDVIKGGMEYMQRSTGRDGSVAYSGGFGGMGGSMNLSAVATLVGAVSRSKETEQYQATLKRLTENLEHSENRGYIEYFRYYMAQALFQGDYKSWQKWNDALVRELREGQSDDGSFPNGGYGTGMGLLAIALNYRFLPIYER